MAKVRITQPILGYLEGTQLWYDIAAGREPAGEDSQVAPLFRRLFDARPRKDGSITLELSPAEAEELLHFVQAQRATARDNTWDPTARGELAACQALIPKLRALTGLLQREE